MAYQALYRKWRPARFAEVIGQDAVVRTLRRQVETGRIAHAYLLCGCRGTGKTTIAKIMSRAVNCLKPDHGDPCGVCEPCRAILSDSTLDVLELDAASNNSVDNVRELLEQVRYPAQVGRYKVYIIDEVHMLSQAAFNALLKTLEEPPPQVVFILATTEPQRIPATILSRVQRFDFGRIPSPLIVQRMEAALAEMGATAQPEALQMVARAAEGAMRDAFSILDMCVSAAGDGAVTAAVARGVLGASDGDFLFGFAQKLAEGDAGGVMRGVDALMRAGHEPLVFLKELSRHVRALLTVLAVPESAAALLEVTDEDELRYREQASHFTRERLLRVLEGLMRAETELRYAASPRVGLEVALLRACAEQRGEDTAALLERIAALETQLAALHTALESGRLAPARGERAGGAAAAPPAADAATPTAKPTKPVPTGEAEIWNQAMALLAKTEPPLFGILKKERFAGAEGNTYRVRVAFERKEFTLQYLGRQQARDSVSRALTEVAGKPLAFEAILDGDGGQKRASDLREENARTLADTVGRELLQVDEGAAKP